VSQHHRQGFSRFDLGDREDILTDRNFSSKYRDGLKARLQCILVVVMQRGTTVFWETAGKIWETEMVSASSDPRLSLQSMWWHFKNKNGHIDLYDEWNRGTWTWLL